MRITTLKVKRDVVTISYEHINLRGNIRKSSIKDNNPPMQSLYERLNDLSDIYKEILEKSNNQVRINGISINYNDKDEISGGVIMGAFYLMNRDKWNPQNTPFLFVNTSNLKDKLPDGTVDKFVEILNEGRHYLNEKYAEFDLFDNGDDSADGVQEDEDMIPEIKDDEMTSDNKGSSENTEINFDNLFEEKTV